MEEKKQSIGKSRFSHWVRVVVMCLSFGFIFPHAMTEEDDDTKKPIPEKGAKIKDP